MYPSFAATVLNSCDVEVELKMRKEQQMTVTAKNYGQRKCLFGESWESWGELCPQCLLTKKQPLNELTNVVSFRTQSFTLG